MILAFDDVTYTYPKADRPALDRVSLQIEEGEVCLLAGLSGHGKSTLLRAACGLAPHFHGGSFAGEVSVVGLSTREHGPARLGAEIGVLFQDPETQLVMSSVRAEISLPLQSRGQSPAEVARGVEEVALVLGIDALLERSTTELSGGEQQRVALAAALCGKPRLVLLDEPTSQLDPVAGDELIGLLRRINQEWDTTILLAEHRLERCLHIADRVIAMRDGRIAHDGDPQSFLSFAAEHEQALQTPGARMFALAGIAPPPVGVRQARATLRARGLLPAGDTSPSERSSEKSSNRGWRAIRSRHGEQEPVLRLKGVWHELPRGATILAGVDLELAAGETVALMGRNGAGKSTLLRHAAGLMQPTRGKVQRSGRVALLLQNPGDYLLRERVGDEASAAALAEVGLDALTERHPRDLSGGERQRLALAIVTDGEEPPAVLALDEPTRGMDRGAKATLAAELRRRAQQGQTVIVATHDPEFAAVCAQRAILLGDGHVIADCPTAELLAGGWYFATETARILGGRGGALLPEQGAELLRFEASRPLPQPLPQSLPKPLSEASR
ncbi:MAG TPA: ATP-binding cassette domain-containing protein [Solirubrobacteraceae bacterium]